MEPSAGAQPDAYRAWSHGLGHSERLYNEFIRRLPETAVGLRLRRSWLRSATAAYGDGALVSRGCRILNAAGLTLGPQARVARDCVLDARGGLELGAGCLIGFESLLLTSTHISSQMSIPVQDQGMFQAASRIGERAWLGTRTLLLPGVSIGDDTIVGACAVVSKDLPSGVVAAGVPARVISLR